MPDAPAAVDFLPPAEENIGVQVATTGPPCLNPEGLRLRYNPVAPSPKQAAFLSLTNREALFGGAGGGGKMQDVDAPILSTRGWTTIGDLEVGDEVFDHDGEPTRILWKSPVEVRKTYLVTMTDGEQILSADTHLWNVASERERERYRRTDPRWQAQRRATRASRGRTPAAAALVPDGRARGTAQAAVETNARTATEAREKRERPSVWDYTTMMTTEQVVALQASERGRVAIPNGGPIRTGGSWRSEVPAYTLGAWLGDGGAADGFIYTCEADREALTRELEADGWTVQVSNTRLGAGSGRTQDFHALKLTRAGRTLRQVLHAEGLLGNKHVPDWVHSAPHADRQAFLGGFCDTDGYVCATRGRVEFCLAREDMVRDVWSLFWSIGETPTRVTHRTTRNQVEGFEGNAWRFQVSDCSAYLFRMPRKRERLARRRPGHGAEYRQVESIIEVDPVPMQCITVDNERGLYRVGRSHLVTHNSIAMLMAALQFVDVPGYNAIILRRTLQSLKLPNGLIDWSHRWLGDTDATWNGNDYQWTFPSGATLTFGYLSHSGSEDKYRSSELHFIGFDELTEFPWEDQYTFMFSRLRKTKGQFGPAPDGLTLDDVPLRVRGATNPGGPGMPWVKARFVAKETAKRPFLASLLSDNPGINAEEYRASLQELSEVERKRMEEGDWDAVEVKGALWRFKDFAWTDRLEPRDVSEVDVRAIGVDPSVAEETGKGDEVGIVMGSITGGTATIELDLSGKMHPDDWARTIVTAYHTYGCTSVLVEDNQGKALLHTALRGAADQLGMDLPRLYVIGAKESKEARALPVAQAYRSMPKRVVHDLTVKGGTLEAQLCFVAGTPVLTRRGWRPIESVRAGTLVLTRRGWRPVEWSGRTGSAATLTTIATTEGESITCTPNHPVWVVGRGWVRADSVAQGDRLLGCHESPNWNTSSSSTGASGSTPTHSLATAAVTGRPTTTGPTNSRTAAPCSTDSCGRTPTAPYPTDTSSTTETATRSTTCSTTSNCSPWAITSATTSEADQSSTPTRRHRRNEPRRRGNSGNRATSSVWPVGRSFSPPECAPCSAPVHVAAAITRPCEATDVYDLSVAGEHEFYAGGVLVHNCSWVPRRGDSPDRLDALVWLVRHLLYGDGKAVQYRAAPTDPAAARSAVTQMMSGRMPGT